MKLTRNLATGNLQQATARARITGMPNLASYHPQIVHFVLALLAAGVLLRWIALAGKWPWTSPAAAALLLAGTLTAVAAVKSGTDAHGPVERIPGVRAAVMEHEEWGERTRNVFLAVAVLEVLALAFAGRPWRRWLYVGSALVGLGGAYSLYEAGAHGGELVYTYAGGVGTRSGDSTDVARLYLAGLYQQALLDRRQGKAAEAAELFAQLVRQFPDNLDVQLLGAESLVRDRKDGKAALVALGKVTLPPDDRRLALRRDFLAADAWALVGKPDSARAILERLAVALPDNPRIRDRLSKLPVAGNR